ncbi:hypothetical protein OHD16_15540 [Sphingobacterium sp. ML3W]|nr:hypothetical protein [Sphingobacterium sp. ML3W]WFA81367.1 hypothetical protein OGI71_08680 [Sphingobacterium sp. ML3W]
MKKPHPVLVIPITGEAAMVAPSPVIPSLKCQHPGGTASSDNGIE